MCYVIDNKFIKKHLSNKIEKKSDNLEWMNKSVFKELFLKIAHYVEQKLTKTTHFH
jgi:hypothetical protein